jgi:hypothetical protein
VPLTVVVDLNALALITIELTLPMSAIVITPPL